MIVLIKLIVFLVQKLLPNKRKNPLGFQRLLLFRCRSYSHQTFKLFDLKLMRLSKIDLTNFIAFLVPKRLRHLVFGQFPLFANNYRNKQNQETYSAWPLTYF